MLKTFYFTKEKSACEDVIITTADLLYHGSKCINSEQRLLESAYEKIRVEAVTFGLVRRLLKNGEQLSKTEERPEVELQFFVDDHGEDFVSKIFASDFTNTEHTIYQRTKMVDILPYKRYFGYFNQVKLSDTESIPFMRIYSNNDIHFTLSIEFSYVLKGMKTINHKFDRVYGTSFFFKYGVADRYIDVGKVYSRGGGNHLKFESLDLNYCVIAGFVNSMFSFGEGDIDPPKLSFDFNIMFDLDIKKSKRNIDTKFLPCPILFDLVKKIHPYPPSCISKSDNIEEMPSENNLVDMLFDGLTIKDFQSGNIERHKGTYIFAGSIRRLPEHIAYNFQERGDNGEIITKQEIESSLYD